MATIHSADASKSGESNGSSTTHEHHEGEPDVLGCHEPRQIMIAVDGSECGEAAFKWALRHIVHPQDSIVIIHVFPPQNLGDTSVIGLSGVAFPYDSFQKQINESLAAARHLVHAYGGRCKKLHLKCETILVHGPPGETLCNVATEIQPAVVVVGSRGLNAMKRLFMGSVSDHLAHNCPVPLVIIKLDGSKA